MAIAIAAVVGLVALVAGLAVGYLLRQRQTVDAERDAQAEADRILAEADRRQKEILLEAKEEGIRVRGQAEAELRERRTEQRRLEQSLSSKIENLDRRLEGFEQREENLRNQESRLRDVQAEVEELRKNQLAEVERIAEMSREEAREVVVARVEDEIQEDLVRRMRAREAEAREESDTRARKVLATAIQRVTTDVVSETTVSVVPIPSDDMKGRIIGREGRNIRALEAATGVDLIIDDTPDAVTLSSFDPVRREIARVTLSKLVMDGRIHPARIEEAVEKARIEVESTIKEAGESGALEAGVPGLHPELLRVFGRLKYRTSYGQNQLRHSIETANVAAIVAKEIGANVDIARRGGLLHDLGKAIDHEVEGTHAMLGAEIARRYNVNPAVVHCIEAHHEEVEPTTVEAVIVMIADAVSGGRPGARRESYDRYVKRLQDLEGIANGFEGVEKSFAISAGREVRVIVKPEDINDLDAMRLARDVSKKIEESMEYPGQIKVTVVRETRATEYAR
ncbi:MAG: ribonuclease Y [Dehalococcoidia bacterium]